MECVVKLVMCPHCGYRFDVGYSRALSCGGCPMSVFGDCKYVRCPRCGREFPLEEGLFTPRSSRPWE